MLGFFFLTFEMRRLGEKSTMASLSSRVPLETWLLGTASPLLQYRVKPTLPPLQIAGAS